MLWASSFPLAINWDVQQRGERQYKRQKLWGFIAGNLFISGSLFPPHEGERRRMVLLKTNLRAEPPGSIPGHVLGSLGQFGEQPGLVGGWNRMVFKALPTQTLL